MRLGLPADAPPWEAECVVEVQPGGATPSTLEEAVSQAIADTVGAAFGDLHHAVAAFRGRAQRLAVTVAEVAARGHHRERALRVLLRWRMACTWDRRS